MCNGTASSNVAQLLRTIFFPLCGCDRRWDVSIEASASLRSVHVFQNQMLYFDIFLGAKFQEDLTKFHLPALAVNERHIWCICIDTYVWQVNVCKQVLEKLFSAVDLVSSRLFNATGEYWICLLYTSPSPRDRTRSRMPSSA